MNYWRDWFGMDFDKRLKKEEEKTESILPQHEKFLTIAKAALVYATYSEQFDYRGWSNNTSRYNRKSLLLDNDNIGITIAVRDISDYHPIQLTISIKVKDMSIGDLKATMSFLLPIENEIKNLKWHAEEGYNLPIGVLDIITQWANSLLTKLEAIEEEKRAEEERILQEKIKFNEELEKLYGKGIF